MVDVSGNRIKCSLCTMYHLPNETRNDICSLRGHVVVCVECDRPTGHLGIPRHPKCPKCGIFQYETYGETIVVGGELVNVCADCAAQRVVALYRHFGKDGRLLYVGISASYLGRLAQHVKSSCWSGDIHTSTVEYFATREEALVAEKTAIETERPVYNKQHSRGRHD